MTRPSLLRALLLLSATVTSAGELVAQPAASVAVPARREFAHGETIVMEYHAASGFGAVELRPVLLSESPEVRLRALFKFRGRAPKTLPDAVTLAIVSSGEKMRFSAKPRVSLLLDDGRRLPAGAAIRQVVRNSTGVTETVAAMVPRAQFLRLLMAREPALVVDGAIIPIGPDAAEALRDLASRMSPSGYAAANRSHIVTERTQGMTVRKTEYEHQDVDSMAFPRVFTPRLPLPKGVPSEMRRVLVEYVVDSTGRVDMATFRGHSPQKDAVFLEQLRVIMPSWEFTPAKVGGRPVRQIMRQAVVFAPAP